MALHVCQIQQYECHHCEQQLEKQCGKGGRTLLMTTVGIVLFLFTCVSFDSALQTHKATDDEMGGAEMIPPT